MIPPYSRLCSPSSVVCMVTCGRDRKRGNCSAGHYTTGTGIECPIHDLLYTEHTLMPPFPSPPLPSPPFPPLSSPLLPSPPLPSPPSPPLPSLPSPPLPPLSLADSMKGVRDWGMPQFRHTDIKGNLYIKFEVVFPESGFQADLEVGN